MMLMMLTKPYKIKELEGEKLILNGVSNQVDMTLLRVKNENQLAQEEERLINQKQDVTTVIQKVTSLVIVKRDQPPAIKEDLAQEADLVQEVEEIKGEDIDPDLNLEIDQERDLETEREEAEIKGKIY